MAKSKKTTADTTKQQSTEAEQPKPYLHKVFAPGTEVRTLLNDAFKIINVLHYGKFGDVYEVEDPVNCLHYCMRTESIECPKSQKKLDTMIRFLSRYELMERRFRRHIISTRACGDWGEIDGMRFFTMELLGPNLDDLRRFHIQANFSKKTAFYLCDSMLRAVGELHKLGYVHRRLSPRSFCVGSTFRETLVFIVGYSHLHFIRRLDKYTKTYAEAYKSNIRGDPTFHCLAAHKKQAIYFRDDLESLLYCFIDVFKMGNVPWTGAAPEAMKEQKVEMRTLRHDAQEKCLPPTFNQFFRFLCSYDKLEKPDFSTMHDTIARTARSYGFNVHSVMPDFLGRTGRVPPTTRPAPTNLQPDDLFYDPDSDTELFEEKVAKLRAEQEQSVMEATTRSGMASFSERDDPKQLATKAAKHLTKKKVPKQKAPVKIANDVFIV